eukprot:5604900-Prorocentrum_lima.AAC.1
MCIRDRPKKHTPDGRQPRPYLRATSWTSVPIRMQASTGMPGLSRPHAAMQRLSMRLFCCTWLT